MINKNELLFVVDEMNRPIEPKPRSEVHSKGYWHRVAHIWIRNNKNQILCQQRSMLKDTKPGYWEAFFGGHLPPGKNYLDGGLLELKEELGIFVPKSQLKIWDIHKYTSRTGKNNEFEAVFLLNWVGRAQDLKLETDEVQQIRWINFEELQKTLLVEKVPSWSYWGYEPEFFKWLRKQNWGEL